MNKRKHQALILFQFAISLTLPSTRQSTIDYFRIARSRLYLPRIAAMDWAVYNMVIDEKDMDQYLKDCFVAEMNDAWGDGDEWMAGLR